MLYDTFTINGIPLESQGRIVQMWDEMRAIGPKRQTNVIVPNRSGEVFLPKAREAKMFTVGLTVTCMDDKGYTPATADGRRRQFNDNWRKFVRLVDSPVPLVMERTLAYPEGLVEKHVAQGEQVGEVLPEMLGPDEARVAVTFKVLDGVWWGEPSDTLDRIGPTKHGAEVGKMAVSNPGDVTTWSIDIIFSKGTGTQRLDNLGTGDWVAYTGDTTTEVTLHVPTFSAMQAGTSVISNVTSGDTQVSPYWMTLLAGPNTLDYQGDGQVQLVFRGAYL